MACGSQSIESFYPPGRGPVPGSAHGRYASERLAETGAWGEETLSDHVRAHSRARPNKLAFIEGASRVTWSQFNRLADYYATLLIDLGVGSGERVAVIYPDGATVHALYVGIERAGAVIVGIGPRAGVKEITHLLRTAEADTVITAGYGNGIDFNELFAGSERNLVQRHIVVDHAEPRHVRADGQRLAHQSAMPDVARQQGVGDLFMLNSTSGTTGMPKCVVHNQNRWLYYHRQVMQSGSFSGDDVFLSLIPAPFGFGLWTAHFTPIILGCTTVVMSRFDAEEAVHLIEREHATVLNCVSTQFVMMLNSDAMQHVDTTSLRCMFTGGEAIPYGRAAQFENDADAVVLNFYGSNETGTLSYTTAHDDREYRLQTGGKIIDEMAVRLIDEAGSDVTATGGPGQAACNGPATSLGYYNDPAANEALFTDDGSMLTADICTIDSDGYLRVVGRSSDIITRGGKNISAAAVEEALANHPAIAVVAAVAVPDDVFGERVCAVIETRHAHGPPSLDEIRAYLAGLQVSKENWPEHLHFVESMPRASGGKIAKSELRSLLAESNGAGVVHN